jgi:hypothetical protein
LLIPGKELTAQIEAMLAFTGWLQVLARPETFKMLTRWPPPSHLLRLLDDYLPFARERQASAATRGDMSGARAVDLMSQVRSLLESWSPPALPVELTEAARALLVADGSYAAFDWHQAPDLPEGGSIEQALVWPPEDRSP